MGHEHVSRYDLRDFRRAAVHVQGNAEHVRENRCSISGKVQCSERLVSVQFSSANASFPPYIDHILKVIV